MPAIIMDISCKRFNVAEKKSAYVKKRFADLKNKKLFYPLPLNPPYFIVSVIPATDQ